MLKRLGKLALRVEKLFGCPQDIEWAISDGEVFLLQSRAITALPKAAAKSWEDHQVWTNANVGEVAPDVLTPLTFSIYEFFGEIVVQPLLRRIGVELGDNPIGGLVTGRIYWNANTGVAMFRHFPRLLGPALNRAFGGEQGKMFELGRVHLGDEDLPDVRFNLVKAILMAPVCVLALLSHSPGKSARFVAHIAGKAKRLQCLHFSSMSDRELAEHLLSTVEGIRDLTPGFLYLGRALIALPALDKVCRKWLGDANGNLASSLLAATGAMDSAQAGHDLWRLALKACEVAPVEEVVLAGRDWQTTRDRLAGVRGDDEFLRAWDMFMERHGHHTRVELELFNPRWSETPDYVLGLVRSYIGSTRRSDPLEEYSKRGRERDRLIADCRRRLRNPVKRANFSHLLAQAQHGSAFRENLKSEAMRYWAMLRKITLQLGERLTSRGFLEAPDDIFFLRLEEIESVTRGEFDFEVRPAVASRRREYEKNKAVTPPSVVIGKFDPDHFVPDAVDVNTDVLTGIAVSPGVAIGKARVILRADTSEHVLTGEILVAPFTDPGWTPYFVPAAGIVMDLGGMLSHGSILAREYGIPAVVNVGPASRIIKTGQTIQVDGNRGVVRILR
jgi:pyruvate,water dikinase